VDLELTISDSWAGQTAPGICVSPYTTEMGLQIWILFPVFILFCNFQVCVCVCVCVCVLVMHVCEHVSLCVLVMHVCEHVYVYVCVICV